jgi:uncharacterized protein YkwD
LRKWRTSWRAVVLLMLGTLLVGSIVLPAGAITTRERAMAQLVNRARERHHLSVLEPDGRVARLARRHSRRMASHNGLFHSCVECIRRAHGWHVVGENVGYAPSIAAMKRAFMRSREHRANILCSCFTRVGIGVIRARGRIWVTELFYRP